MCVVLDGRLPGKSAVSALGCLTPSKTRGARCLTATNCHGSRGARCLTAVCRKTLSPLVLDGAWPSISLANGCLTASPWRAARSQRRPGAVKSRWRGVLDSRRPSSILWPRGRRLLTVKSRQRLCSTAGQCLTMGNNRARPPDAVFALVTGCLAAGRRRIQS